MSYTRTVHGHPAAPQAIGGDWTARPAPWLQDDAWEVISTTGYIVAVLYGEPDYDPADAPALDEEAALELGEADWEPLEGEGLAWADRHTVEATARRVASLPALVAGLQEARGQADGALYHQLDYLLRLARGEEV